MVNKNNSKTCAIIIYMVKISQKQTNKFVLQSSTIPERKSKHSAIIIYMVNISQKQTSKVNAIVIHSDKMEKKMALLSTIWATFSKVSKCGLRICPKLERKETLIKLESYDHLYIHTHTHTHTHTHSQVE